MWWANGEYCARYENNARDPVPETAKFEHACNGSGPSAGWQAVGSVAIGATIVRARVLLLRMH